PIYPSAVRLIKSRSKRFGTDSCSPRRTRPSSSPCRACTIWRRSIINSGVTSERPRIACAGCAFWARSRRSAANSLAPSLFFRRRLAHRSHRAPYFPRDLVLQRDELLIAKAEQLSLHQQAPQRLACDRDEMSANAGIRRSSAARHCHIVVTQLVQGASEFAAGLA